MGEKYRDLFNKEAENIEIYGPLSGYHVLAARPDSANADEIPIDELMRVHVYGYFCVGKTAIYVDDYCQVERGDKWLYVMKDGSLKSTVEPIDNECLVCKLGYIANIPERRFDHGGITPEFGDVLWIDGRLPEEERGRKRFRANVLGSRNGQLWKMPPIDEPESIKCNAEFEKAVRGEHSVYSLPYINRAVGYAFELESPDDSYTDIKTLPGNNNGWFYPVDDHHYLSCKLSDTPIAMNKRVKFTDCYFDQGNVPCVFQGQSQYGYVGSTHHGSIIERCTFTNTNIGPDSSTPIMARIAGLRMVDCLAWDCGADFVQAGVTASSFENCCVLWVGVAGEGKHGDGFQISGNFGLDGDMLDISEAPMKSVFPSIRDAKEFARNNPWWDEQIQTGKRFIKIGRDEHNFDPHYMSNGDWVFGFGDVSGIPFKDAGGITSHFQNKNWVGYCPGKCTPWGREDAEGNGSIYISTTYGYTSDAYIIGGYHTGGSCPIQIEQRNEYRTSNLVFKDLLIGIDNEFGFASTSYINTDAGTEPVLDPIAVWENNRRVDSGELIKKPVVAPGESHARATWDDYRA